MRVYVHVTPRAKRPSLEVLSDGSVVVRVTEPAEGGRANAAVVERLAEHFQVPRRSITIVRGLTSRRKLIEIVVALRRLTE